MVAGVISAHCYDSVFFFKPFQIQYDWYIHGPGKQLFLDEVVFQIKKIQNWYSHIFS